MGDSDGREGIANISRKIGDIENCIDNFHSFIKYSIIECYGHTENDEHLEDSRKQTRNIRKACYSLYKKLVKKNKCLTEENIKLRKELQNMYLFQRLANQANPIDVCNCS